MSHKRANLNSVYPHSPLPKIEMDSRGAYFDAIPWVGHDPVQRILDYVQHPTYPYIEELKLHNDLRGCGYQEKEKRINIIQALVELRERWP